MSGTKFVDLVMTERHNIGGVWKKAGETITVSAAQASGLQKRGKAITKAQAKKQAKAAEEAKADE